ncbi:MAG: 4Fe-4S binding protein [Nitrososphaerota archaeon]|nr:4Fe-4S binding protein [Nitrososphaerota archaeon]
MNWKNKRGKISTFRYIIQLLFFFLIFYLSTIGVWKGVLLLIVFGMTLFLGRFFCGWLCPFGLYMDTITLLRKHLKIPYWSLPQKINHLLHIIRYSVVFMIFLLVLLIFLSSVSFFELSNFIWLRPPFLPYLFFLEPLQTIVLPWKPPFGALFEISGIYFTYPYVGEILMYLQKSWFALPLAVIFVGVTLGASFKVRRFWCRFCPTGISFAAINRVKRFRVLPFLGLSKDGEKCTKCGICKRVCPVQVTEIYEKKTGKIATSMCVLCLRCVEMCPQRNCLSLKLANRVIWNPE